MKPVLVVGAGPVGMTMASELTRFGVPVRIFDKAARRTDKSKALVIWSRTLELLDRGDGGSAPFVDAGFKAEGANFFAGDKPIGHLSLEGVKSPHAFGLMIPQSETERLLEERLAGQGVTVGRRVELASFRNGPDGVEATLRHDDGREETVSTDWLVGCDGAHSAVRHGLGDPFSGKTLESDWLLADIHVTGYEAHDREISIYWHRDGILAVFPIKPGRCRVIADQPASGAEHPTTPTLEHVQEVITRRGPEGLRASDPVWLSGFRINGRKVADYRFGRTFLVGDAAHVHSPAGGQGMNTGMQDAFNLAWKLALVAQGTCDDHLLDSYSPERSHVGDEVIKMADRITEIGTLHNPVLQTVRNVAAHLLFGLSPVRHNVADAMTEVSIGYPKTPLNGPDKAGHGPKPGERIEPLPGQEPIGSGKTPRFALFSEPTPATSDLLKKFEALLDPHLRPPFHEGGIWLARPDGYLACSSRDAADIAAYLEALALPAKS